MKRIGVRELRQNASEHLRRVQRGETLEITDRGQPIARLVPIGAPASRLDALEAEGRLTPTPDDLLELGPPLPSVAGRPHASKVLARMRQAER